MHSLIENTKKNVGVFLFIALVAAVMSLGFTAAVQFAGAHQDPVDCNASGLQQFPSIVSPAGVATHGDTITYAVIYNNTDPDGAGGTQPCNITGADATITRPDGSVINVLTDATLNVGGSISCPGGAGCAAGPYTYNIAHVDEVAGSVTAAFDIDGVLHQDENEEVASDHDTLSKTVAHPSTITSITSSDASVVAGGTVDLTITEQNDGDIAINTPSVTVDNGIGTLSNPPDSGDTNTNGILNIGETWSWTETSGPINGNTTFTATGTGAVNGDTVTWCADPQTPPANTICDQDEQDSVDVTTIDPSTEVSAEVDVSAILVGSNVNITITEANDGDVDLTNPFVNLQPLGLTLDETSTTFQGGDAGDLGVLDPGETWTWIVVDTPPTATTYIATGHGTDSLGNDVTWCENPQSPPANTVCDQNERDTVEVTVNSPSTITTITSSASSVNIGGTVNLTITEQNNGNAALSNVSVTVDNGIGTLTSPPDSGDTNTNGILNVGETWSWTETSDPINADTTFTATGTGTINGTTVTWCADPQSPPANTFCDQDEQDSVDVDVINPTTVTTIASSVSEVTTGGTVTLTITEENDGDVDLSNPHVDVDNGIGTLDETSASFAGVDGGDAGVLDAGETWTWVINNVVVNADTTFTATGHGTDPLGNDITYPADQDEQGSVSVTVTEPSWCSPGYWKNHPEAADDAAEAGGFDMDDSYASQFGSNPPLKPKGIKDGAPESPSLRQVLDNPAWYGGDAYNLVADLLSASHPDLDFEEGGARIENCTLN